MKMVIVYSAPGCIRCTQTIRFLEKNSIEYKTIDVSQDEESMNKLTKMGFNSLPVVESDDDIWSGFRDSKLRGLLLTNA